MFRQGDLEEGCGERPQHARAHHGAVPLCSQVTSRRAGKRFKQAFVRLSNGCNRVTWDEDDGGGKLSLDLNQVMRISVGLETPLMISDELLIASLIR